MSSKVKVENEKVGLKLNIQKMKIMASGPITSWEIDGETVKRVSDFIFFISSVICWLFRSLLFSLHMFVFLIVFFPVVDI